jgi:hypothetical protein
MRATAPLVLAAAMTAISCTVSSGGLGVTPDEERSEAGPSGRVAPDPSGFAGMTNDAGVRPPMASADAGAILADAAAAPTVPPPPPPTSAPPPASPPDAGPAAPPSVPTEARVLRIHDLKVGRLVARVVHAHELDAAAGSPGLVLPPEPDALLKLQLGSRDLEVAELTVDILYAHDIKAGWVHIDRTHARIKKKEHGQGED